jgi:hypothetical protein
MVPAHEADLVDELAQHLDDQYNELRARGRSDDEARLQLASQLTDEFLRAAADSCRRARHAPLHILSELAAWWPTTSTGVPRDRRAHGARCSLE